VGDVELLVGDQELTAHILARVDLLLRVSTFAGEGEAILHGIPSY